jgi:hypothetical protein
MNSVKSDTPFMASARELQDRWRIRKGYPIGTYTNPKGESVPLGNYIERAFAFEKGANFLTQNIHEVVKGALYSKEIGAKIDVDRLYTNLLSSQPLAFNLFAELSLNDIASTSVFSELFPGRIKKATKILFEHSDGRGDPEYTGDRSAFDVFVEYDSIDGRRGFVAIEVKYSENLHDKPSSHKQRYEELSDQSGYFKPGSFQFLKQKPIQQIWRDHLLSLAHLKHEKRKYDEGFFVYLFPSGNEECKNGVAKYVEQLNYSDFVSKEANEKKTGFYPRHIEDFVRTLQLHIHSEWTKELWERYLNFGSLQ